MQLESIFVKLFVLEFKQLNMANIDFSKRDSFSSKFGVIAATAGSAVGLGNIWRFPYVAGESGGGAFVLIYLGFFLLHFGIFHSYFSFLY